MTNLIHILLSHENSIIIFYGPTQKITPLSRNERTLGRSEKHDSSLKVTQGPPHLERCSRMFRPSAEQCPTLYNRRAPSSDRNVLPCRTATALAVARKEQNTDPISRKVSLRRVSVSVRLAFSISCSIGRRSGALPPRSVDRAGRHSATRERPLEFNRCALGLGRDNRYIGSGWCAKQREQERPYPGNKSQSKYLKRAVEVSLNGVLRSLS